MTQGENIFENGKLKNSQLSAVLDKKVSNAIMQNDFHAGYDPSSPAFSIFNFQF